MRKMHYRYAIIHGNFDTGVILSLPVDTIYTLRARFAPHNRTKIMRIHTETHGNTNVHTAAQTEPCVNEVTAPVEAVKLTMAGPSEGRPRLLARRGARWARRANH